MLKPAVAVRYALATGYIFTMIAGCTGPTPPETDACVTDNPASTDEDFASDMWHNSCPVAPDDTSPAPCEPPTVADIEAQCEAEGAPCADTIVVGHDAALCIAAREGLAEGLDGLHADLLFNSRFGAPIWAVSNVLEDAGYEGSSGESVSISAETGELLERSSWDASP